MSVQIRYADGARPPFTQVPSMVMRDGNLPASARTLYAILLSYAWQESECWPSQATLGEDLGISDRRTRGHLRELEEAKLIRTERENGHNVYLLLALPRKYASERPTTHRTSASGTTGRQRPPKKKQDEETLSLGVGEILPASIQHDLDAVAKHKGTQLDAVAAARAIKRYPDRDHEVEAEAFRFWWTKGNGQNRRLRNVGLAWNNWLRGAAPKGAPARGSRRKRFEGAAVDRRVEDLLAGKA